MADFEAKLNMSLDDVIKASKKKLNKDKGAPNKKNPAKANDNSKGTSPLNYY